MSRIGKTDLERGAAEMMAWSETRLAQTPAGSPALALWLPKEPAVAIGVSQSSEHDIIPEALREDCVSLVRRPSGGGSVVLCPGVLCWEAWADLDDVKRLAAVGSVSSDNGIRSTYAVLSAPVVQALRVLGIDAFHAGVCDIAARVDSADAAPRKLAGTAQLRRRAKALVHGSLLVNADFALLARYLPHPDKAPDYRAARDHSAFCANVSDFIPAAGDPVAAVADAIRTAAGTLGWTLLVPPETLPPDAEELARGKYLSPDWNWNKVRSTG